MVVAVLPAVVFRPSREGQGIIIVVGTTLITTYLGCIFYCGDTGTAVGGVVSSVIGAHILRVRVQYALLVVVSKT